MENKKNIVELVQDIGKQGRLRIILSKKYEVIFPVVIKNVEVLYGAPCYTIEPVNGSGQARVREGLEIL